MCPPIDKACAEAIYDILVKYCHAMEIGHKRDHFVYDAVNADNDPYGGISEWRFYGSLGFGGKFRNSETNETKWYVDCYQEDETPQRLERIEQANVELGKLRARHDEGQCQQQSTED